jgi:hypothetical protein
MSQAAALMASDMDTSREEERCGNGEAHAHHVVTTWAGGGLRKDKTNQSIKVSIICNRFAGEL